MLMDCQRIEEIDLRDKQFGEKLVNCETDLVGPKIESSFADSPLAESRRATNFRRFGHQSNDSSDRFGRHDVLTGTEFLQGPKNYPRSENVSNHRSDYLTD